MNRTTEIHSQELENEGQNQKLPRQHSANGDGPRLVACVLLLPEDAEVLAGLLCNLATNSHVSQDLDALANPDRLLRPEPGFLAASRRSGEIPRRLDEYPISLCVPGED